MNIQNDTVIKILFLAANPIDKPPLRIDREFRAVDEALQRADFSKKFDIRYYGAAQIGDLQEQLLQHKPHIVHFSGHGNTSSEIILEDDNRNARPVTQNALRQLFTLLKDNIKCVVLNACYSASQAAAIAESIDCVIGISDAIDDEASILFASAFYRALGDGRDVKKAFDLSCNRLNLEDYEEHNKPQILAPRLNPSHLYFVNQEPNQVTPMLEDLQSNRASHFKLDDSPIFTEQIIEILSEALEPISISDIVDILQILPSEARKVINFLDDYIILDDRGFFCPFSQGMKNQWKLVLGSHDRPNLLSSWCKKYQRWGWRDNTPTYVFNHCATHFEQDRDTAALLGLIDQKYIEQKFCSPGLLCWNTQRL
ncbi:MAG: CHAT domain-containing protein [Caldilineaceae bacterium]